MLYELEHEVRTLDHATSPFKHSQPYLLAGLEAVPELVSSVTSDHERDFAAERRKRMSAKKGFVPRPLGVCYEPIQFYTWDTPNGKKISILLEELKLPYQVIPVDISAGEQRFPEFLEVCPNGKIPAIRDPNQGGAGPLTVFESGAILMYLAERYGRRELLPRSPEGRIRCQEWLFFQVSGFGPAAGQVHHFAGLMEGQEDAEVKSAAAYGFARYHSEVTRQYGVMDAWLSKNEYFTGDEYTIADIAIFSWVWRAWRHKIDLHEFPNVKRWYDKISQRRAVLSGLQVPGKLLPTLGMINQICG